LEKTNIVSILLPVTFIILVACTAASASPSLVIDPSEPVSVGAGETIDVSLGIDELPDGLSGYTITVELDDPEVAEITAVEYPGWVSVTEDSSLPDSSIYIKAFDGSSQVQSGAQDVVLATLTLEGLSGGSAGITVTVTRLDDDDGEELIIEGAEYPEEDDPDSGSSGSSSSGSGGGGGSSGESYEKIAVKEVKTININAGSHISYEFDEAGNPIAFVSFDAFKNSGEIQTIIEVLNNRSSFADIDAPGTIYRQMNIWVGKSGFANENNIENMSIGFSVEKAWLEENDIDEDMISLYRYADGSWNELSTEITGEDDAYVSFESQTPGFSPFAISYEAAEPISEEGPESPDNTDNGTASQESNSGADADTEPQNTPGFGAGFAVAGLVLAAVAGIYLSGSKR
jgi:PGF-pre-PGF domain-containing protein